MNRVVQWGPLVELIAPVYPKGEGAGRPLVGLDGMLRIHCLQHGFNLSDPAIGEALYDSRAMRGFVGIDDCCRREKGSPVNRVGTEKSRTPAKKTTCAALPQITY